jgi:transposase
MGRGDLTNEEWARLKPHLPKSGKQGGRWAEHRRIVNGILFRQRTGVPWRDLPTRFGKWKTVYERHRRWSADGTGDRVFAAILADADAESRIDWSMVSVDSTSCRAHQHAAGARKRRPRVPGKRATPRQHRPDEGLGRSRGGLTSKIHLAGEGGRRPLAFLITPGQWPRDTTRGPTSSTGSSPSPQSGSGSAHDPPNPGPSGKLLIATPSAMPRLSEVRSTVPSWQPEST